MSQKQILDMTAGEYHTARAQLLDSNGLVRDLRDENKYWLGKVTALEQENAALKKAGRPTMQPAIHVEPKSSVANDAELVIGNTSSTESVLQGASLRGKGVADLSPAEYERARKELLLGR